jgi:hypothetical protein
MDLNMAPFIGLILDFSKEAGKKGAEDKRSDKFCRVKIKIFQFYKF